MYLGLSSLQPGESETRVEVDSEHSAVPHKKWQFWKQSGEKKPQKFGWIMGVLVSVMQCSLPAVNVHTYEHFSISYNYVQYDVYIQKGRQIYFAYCLCATASAKYIRT